MDNQTDPFASFPPMHSGPLPMPSDTAPEASSVGGKGTRLDDGTTDMLAVDIEPPAPDMFDAKPVALHWLDEAPPEREWFLRHHNRGWLTKGTVALMTATGGTGKTRALMHLAIAVATGTPWLDVFHPSKPGKVLMALGEDGQDDDPQGERQDVRRRFHDVWEAQLERHLWRMGNPVFGPFLPMSADRVAAERAKFRDNLTRNLVTMGLRGEPVTIVGPEPDSEPQALVRLRNTMRHHAGEGGLDLVILDPSSRFQGAESETDNATATRYVQTLERLAMDESAGKPTILISHHTTKPSQKNDGTVNLHDQHTARGSSALVDGVRWAIALTFDPFNPSHVYLAQTKVNDAARMKVVVETAHTDHGLIFVKQTTNADVNRVFVNDQAALSGKAPKRGEEPYVAEVRTEPTGPGCEGWTSEPVASSERCERRADNSDNEWGL